MFMLIRLPLLLGVAFVAGMFYERGQQREVCENSGGVWTRGAYCVGK